MEIGMLYRDSQGRHPFAEHSWLGVAEWVSSTWDHFPERDGPGLVLNFESLLASVPASLQQKVETGEVPKAAMQFLPWYASGVGLVTFVAGDDALIGVMDIAGRRDLRHLLAADAEGCVQLTACRAGELERCPSVLMEGAGASIEEAEARRRLSGKEFQDAVEDVRWLLRSRAAFALLGQSRRGLSSLTLNVVQPFKGRSATMHN